jgi:hypothetical protein
MAWFETHFPWKLFHPDVLDIVAVSTLWLSVFTPLIDCSMTRPRISYQIRSVLDFSQPRRRWSKRRHLLWTTRRICFPTLFCLQFSIPSQRISLRVPFKTSGTNSICKLLSCFDLYCRPSGMHDLIDQNTREVRHRFASVQTMDDVDHYVSFFNRNLSAAHKHNYSCP